jgi:hypothetical protein
MSKKILLFTALFSFILFSWSCAAGPITQTTGHPPGLIYTSVASPHAQQNIELALPGDLSSMRMGRATASSILGLFATGNNSIRAAMQDGGIREVKHVDQETFSLLSIITRHTTIVYGN